MTDSDLDAMVGANVQRLRTALGMSQTDLAEQMGENYRQQTVLKIEKGQRPLRLAEADAIARALDVSVEQLLARSVEESEALAGTRRAIESVDVRMHSLAEAAEDLVIGQYLLRTTLAMHQDRLDESTVDEAEHLASMSPVGIVNAAQRQFDAGIESNGVEYLQDALQRSNARRRAARTGRGDDG